MKLEKQRELLGVMYIKIINLTSNIVWSICKLNHDAINWSNVCDTGAMLCQLSNANSPGEEASSYSLYLFSGKRSLRCFSADLITRETYGHANSKKLKVISAVWDICNMKIYVIFNLIIPEILIKCLTFHLLVRKLPEEWKGRGHQAILVNNWQKYFAAYDITWTQ